MKKLMPFITKLEPGSYYWCTCGETKKQPFCDGSHVGTEQEPLIFTITEKNRWRFVIVSLPTTRPFATVRILPFQDTKTEMKGQRVGGLYMLSENATVPTDTYNIFFVQK